MKLLLELSWKTMVNCECSYTEEFQLLASRYIQHLVATIFCTYKALLDQLCASYVVSLPRNRSRVNS